jgi:hypothetical protein
MSDTISDELISVSVATKNANEHFEYAAHLLETDYISLTLAAQCYRSLDRQSEALTATQRALERIDGAH